MSKVARNSPCPCGSGKKYKYCCLRNRPEHRWLTRRVTTGSVVLILLALGYGAFALLGRVLGPRSIHGKNGSGSQQANQSVGTNSIPLPPVGEKPLPRQAGEADREQPRRENDLNEDWRRAVERDDCERALQIAGAISVISPYKSSSWLKQAYSLHELGRTEDAFQVLSSVIEMFPDEYLPAYNLACYACKTGRLDEARHWLRNSIEVGGRERVKATALRDSDLETLWQEINRW